MCHRRASQSGVERRDRFAPIVEILCWAIEWRNTNHVKIHRWLLPEEVAREGYWTRGGKGANFHAQLRSHLKWGPIFSTRPTCHDAYRPLFRTGRSAPLAPLPKEDLSLAHLNIKHLRVHFLLVCTLFLFVLLVTV